MRYDEIPDMAAPDPTSGSSAEAALRLGPVPRRTVLVGAAAAAAVGFGSRFLGVVGKLPAAYGNQTCSTSGLTYSPDCVGQNYVTNCTDGGCDPRYSIPSASYCLAQTWTTRHRTCGETIVVNGHTKNFKMRHNECYNGVYDGWRWVGVDNGSYCGCSFFVREWHCKDGWVNDNGGAYDTSICVQSRCPSI